MSLQVSLVPTAEVGRVWPTCAPMLDRAVKISEHRYSLEDLHQKLSTGEFDLWIVFDEDAQIIASITSTFTYYPQAKSLHGQFLGGSRLDEWQDQFCDIFDRWAKDNHCNFVEFTGRPGWKRVLARNGYREVFTTYQRDL